MKLDTVASDILGVSGRAIIQAIIDGVESPNFLAERAKGRLGKKIPQLRLACADASANTIGCCCAN